MTKKKKFEFSDESPLPKPAETGAVFRQDKFSELRLNKDNSIKTKRHLSHRTSKK